jgi:hypothetical protein
MERVICPPPSRERHDDRVVEVFLHAYQQGCFADNPDWLPQHERNVEVIATSNVDRKRLAIEHTRVFAFEGHMEQESVLRPIAERLEAIRLPELSGRWVQIFFAPNFMGRLLQRHSRLVQEELLGFLNLILPTIAPGEHQVHHFVVPIPLPDGRRPTIEFDVEVWGDMDVKRPICVNGVLPQGRTLDSQVRQALDRKLNKLVEADADIRFLMIDIPTHTDSDISVAKAIGGLQGQFQLLAKVDEVVFAKTFAFESEGCIFFRTWKPQSEVWSSGFINASIEKSAMSYAS